jgi:hypothetical protein
MLHLICRAGQDGDPGASSSQAGGHGAADAPAASGHQGDPAVQRFVRYLHSLS